MPKTRLRDDLELAWELRGPEDAPVLVLLTGLGGLKEGWFRQVPFFSKSWRVLTLDNRGMGGSSVVDRALTMRDMAEDVVLLLDALGIERAHVWGVSMGGKIAQELALGWPHRVDRLILENTSAGEAHRVEGRGRTPLRDAWRASAETWRDDIIPLLFGPRYREANARSMDALARSRERHPPSEVAFKRQLEAYESFDSWDRLEGLEARVLVLAGAEDALTSPGNSARLAERLPHATLAVVEGGGHSVHIELPDEVNARVQAFLQAP